MDKKEPVKKPSEDVTRESLIAISYGSPDVTAGEKVVKPLGRDGDEKYRSKLISLSSSPPPDVKVLPFVPGQPHA